MSYARALLDSLASPALGCSGREVIKREGLTQNLVEAGAAFETVDRDTRRTMVFSRDKEVQEKCRKTMNAILHGVCKEGHYIQGMGDIISIIVEAFLSEHGLSLDSEKFEALAKYCFFVLEKFMIPLADDGFRPYAELFGITKDIARRRGISLAPHLPEEAHVLTFIQQILLLYSREAGSLEDACRLFEYFLKRKTYQPFLFLLSALPDVAAKRPLTDIPGKIRETEALERKYGRMFEGQGGDERWRETLILVTAGGAAMGLLALGVAFYVGREK